MPKKSNVFSQGQGGGVFELNVQTAFLINMLIGHRFPGLLPGKAELIRFQASSPPYNFETDDIFVELISDSGTRHKLLVQVKHNLSFTEKDETFAQIIQDAWGDFNSETFDPDYDRFLVVKGNLSSNEYSHLVKVLDWTKYKYSYEDFYGELSTSVQKMKLFKAFKTQLKKANEGKELTKEQLWKFLKCFNVVAFDFDQGNSTDKSNYLTLIDKSKNSGSTAEDIWNKIFEYVSKGNSKGASINLESCPPIIKDYFKEENLPSIYESPDLQNIESNKFKRVLKELRSSSSALLSWQNKLTGLDFHIEREETKKVIAWLFKPLNLDKEKPISIIHGRPGIGKTVIMRDICEVLQSKDVPTLGIRSDLYQAEDFESLGKSLNFSNSIVETIEYLADNYPLVVVLFDQIDALSQSFSGNPLFLDTYNQLIWRLSDIPNLRIIISSRTYDLNNDPTLKEYTKSSAFEVRPLNEENVKTVLGKLNISISQLSPDFIQILRTPNHLNVFCKVSKKGKNLNQLKTLRDLYDELWEQFLEKFKSENEEDKLIALAGDLAKKLNSEQRLSVSNTNVVFHKRKGLRKKLISGGILIENDDSIQFFHQTFYEYFFARQFVKSGSDLKSFIVENHQGLSCRAAVKLILQFYRDSDLTEYINWLRTLIFDNEIRFHFKYLALSILADQSKPTKKEQDFLVSDVLSHPRFGVLFLKQKKSKNWISFFIKSGIANALVFPNNEEINSFEIQILDEFDRGEVGNSRRHLLSMLHELIKEEPEIVLKFFKSIPEFEEKSDFVSRMLYLLKDWSIPEAIELYEEYESVIKSDSYRFFTIFKNAIDKQYEWVLKELHPFLLNTEAYKKRYTQDRTYPFNTDKIIEKLFERDRERTFHFFMETLMTVLSNQEENSWGMQYYFKSSYVIDPDIIDDRYSGKPIAVVYGKLRSQIVIYSKNEPEKFQALFQRYYRTKWESILRLMLSGLFEKPKLYVDETMSLIEFIYIKKGFEKPRLTNVQYYLRKILAENISGFITEQWERLKIIFSSFSNEHQAQIREISGKKVVKNFIDYDLMLYLQVLPEEFLKKDLPVWKKYQELKRRYVKLEDKRSNGGTLRGVPPPLSESAYEKMSDENWKKSFKKYDKNYKADFWENNGDSYQHKSQFNNCVKENPKRFLSLVEELIDDESFYSQYALAGLEGLRGAKIQSDLFLRLFMKALHRKTDEEYEMKRYVYLIRFFNSKEPLDPQLSLWLENVITTKGLSESISKQFEKEPSESFVSDLKKEIISEWMYLKRLKRDEAGIFEIINKAIEINDENFRGAVIEKIPFLLHFNRSKCLTLFKKLIKDREEKIVEKSLYSLNYLIWDDFEGLISFVKEVYKKEGFQEKLAQILAIQWIEGRNEAWSILKEITDENEKAILKIPEIAIYKIKQNKPEFFERSKTLFQTFLNHPSEEVAKAYDFFFYKLEQQDFQDVKPLLVEYKKSYAAKKIPAEFFRYLRKCVSRYSKEVIELMDFWENYDSPDIFSEGYHRGEPIQILIAIYRHLVEKPGDNSKRINTVLDMVDKMLENPNLMGTSIETIEKFEIG